MEGGKRAGSWNTSRWTPSLMKRKHSNLRSHVLVGIQDQGNVVKVVACCGLAIWQGGKTDGPQTKICFPHGDDDRECREEEGNRKSENLKDLGTTLPSPIGRKHGGEGLRPTYLGDKGSWRPNGRRPQVQEETWTPQFDARRVIETMFRPEFNVSIVPDPT